ncbi:MAG: matrixin family metalloprotease [Ignavibacteria bacterium]|nr:matrixin family metalloprotease [Ignavibacteria bacterium]
MKKLSFVLILLLFSNAIAQNTWWHLNASGKFLYESPILNGSLRWYNYLDLKIDEDFNTNCPFTNADSRFYEALEEWKDVINQNGYYLNFYTGQSGNGIKVFWTTDPDYFSNILTVLAVTQPCVANNQYVVSCTEAEAQIMDTQLNGSPLVTQARIVYNATPQFLNLGYLTDISCVSTPNTKINIKILSMHELGHILGLPHSNPNTPAGQYSIMYYQPTAGNYCDIDDSDGNWLRQLIRSIPITENVDYKNNYVIMDRVEKYFYTDNIDMAKGSEY